MTLNRIDFGSSFACCRKTLTSFPTKAVSILRDHLHHSPGDTGICEHCGQPLPGSRALGYGEIKPVNRTGVAVTIGVHLLLLLAFLIKPDMQVPIKPPAGGDITYVTPLEGKPKPKEAAPAPKVQPKPQPKRKPERTAPVQARRLPDAISLPPEQPKVSKPVEKTPEKPVLTEVDPSMDMAAAIEAKRRARGQDTTSEQGEESEADRGRRVALANIASANGKAVGDGNDTGGVFSISNKTFASADLKFRGWNQNFKRRWLQQVKVERGGEADIETAIVKKMIELIRKEKPGDFEWDSHRLQRVVKMSARAQDQAELEAFLFKEMFPEYNRRPGR